MEELYERLDSIRVHETLGNEQKLLLTIHLMFHLFLNISCHQQRCLFVYLLGIYRFLESQKECKFMSTNKFIHNESVLE